MTATGLATVAFMIGVICLAMGWVLGLLTTWGLMIR